MDRSGVSFTLCIPGTMRRRSSGCDRWRGNFSPTRRPRYFACWEAAFCGTEASRQTEVHTMRIPLISVALVLQAALALGQDPGLLAAQQANEQALQAAQMANQQVTQAAQMANKQAMQ